MCKLHMNMNLMVQFHKRLWFLDTTSWYKSGKPISIELVKGAFQHKVYYISIIMSTPIAMAPLYFVINI